MNRATRGKVARDEHHRSWSALLRRLGATHIGVWVIKHVLSPCDRWLYHRTGGRWVALGKPLGPLLLLTTTGRHTGKEHTIPVYYLRDGARLVVCNVNPGFEHANPWTLNLRAHPIVTVQIGTKRNTYQACEANPAEVEHYWPQLVRMWPAYQTFYEQSGQRVIFLLDPLPIQPGDDSVNRGKMNRWHDHG